MPQSSLPVLRTGWDILCQMQQEEDEIPDAIRRLEANEAYEAAIRRDMNYLEGEKQAWVYCMEEVKEEMHHLRIFSYVLFGVFIVLMEVILVLQGVKYVDTKQIGRAHV